MDKHLFCLLGTKSKLEIDKLSIETTANARKLIKTANEFLEQKYSAKVVYNDIDCSFVEIISDTKNSEDKSKNSN